MTTAKKKSTKPVKRHGVWVPLKDMMEIIGINDRGSIRKWKKAYPILDHTKPNPRMKNSTLYNLTEWVHVAVKKEVEGTRAINAKLTEGVVTYRELLEQAHAEHIKIQADADENLLIDTSFIADHVSDTLMKFKTEVTRLGRVLPNGITFITTREELRDFLREKLDKIFKIAYDECDLDELMKRYGALLEEDQKRREDDAKERARRAKGDFKNAAGRKKGGK